MKIYVVRHCITAYSANKIYCSRTDSPLSEEGREQAKRLTEEALAVDLIFSSPLRRALETAEAVRGERDISILLDRRLRERDFGDFEGTPVSRQDGKAFRYSFAAGYPNGESNLQVASRVYAFLDETIARHAGKNICIVSHGSACRLIRTYFVQMTDEAFFAYSQPNGEVTTYEV